GTGLGGNCTGCVICSEENGCSTCQQRLFLFIRREGIRQYGKCVHDCPLGFFGIRGQEVNRCKKCGATCESCFSQDFCIRCKRRFYLYKGKCLPSCPPGTLTHQNTQECQETRKLTWQKATWPWEPSTTEAGHGPSNRRGLPTPCLPEQQPHSPPASGGSFPIPTSREAPPH
ncbi:Hypothetical predicted protein, partial [Marmota monax]